MCERCLSYANFTLCAATSKRLNLVSALLDVKNLNEETNIRMSMARFKMNVKLNVHKIELGKI